MKILGIETSCDETAASVVEDGWSILSSVIYSSSHKHAETGGIVPEVAARDATKKILPAISAAILQADSTYDDIDAIAVTVGPGLLGSLLVGIETAKILAYTHKKSLIPIHHIAGHICANRLLRQTPPQFPALVLTVSGGHNELVLWKSDYEFETIGRTRDDSAGEAFDKVARMLGLGFPGGPEISRIAQKGYAMAYSFPRPMLKSGDCDFSFSGLKTAVLYTLRDLGGNENIDNRTRADIAASFQQAVVETLSHKLFFALKQYPEVKGIHIGGGVSANRLLRQHIFLQSERLKASFHFPEKISFCTDNAEMIAAAGYWKMKKYPDADWDWRKAEPYMKIDFF